MGRRRGSEGVELVLGPLEPIAFLGSAEARVLSGRLSILGAELRPSRAWHALHSPAGGLSLALQTSSAVSSEVRLLFRPLEVVAEEGEAERGGEATAGNLALDQPADDLLAWMVEEEDDEEEEEGSAPEGEDTEADSACTVWGAEAEADGGEEEYEVDGVAGRARTPLAADEEAAALERMIQTAQDAGRAEERQSSCTSAGLSAGRAAIVRTPPRADSDGAFAWPLPDSLGLLPAAVPPGLMVRLGAVIPAAWEDGVDEVCRLVEAARSVGAPPPVVMLCGERNTGKSSLLRLLINRLIALGGSTAPGEEVAQPMSAYGPSGSPDFFGAARSSGRSGGGDDVDSEKGMAAKGSKAGKKRGRKSGEKTSSVEPKRAASSTSAQADSNTEACGAGASELGRNISAEFIDDSVFGSSGPSRQVGVALLDTDVGQPEIGPPGMISLRRVEVPLFGPPHSHHRTTQTSWETAVFFGATSPAADPRFFIDGVRSVLHATSGSSSLGKARVGAEGDGDPGGAGGSATKSSVLSSLPVIVNTCGWVQGMGQQLLAETIAAVQPSILIVLDREIVPGVPQRSQPFPLAAVLPSSGPRPQVMYLPSLTAGVRPSSVSTSTPGLAAGFVNASAAGTDPASDGSTLAIGTPTARDSTALPTPGWLGDPAPPPATNLSPPSAAEARQMQLLAYFGALPRGARSLPASSKAYATSPAWGRAIGGILAAKPYAVRLDAIKVKMLHHPQLSRDELLRSLDASIVGLGCEIKGDVTDTTNEADQGHPVTATFPSCVGLAIVRSVDPNTGTLFLVTPVPVATIRHVNVLMRGSLELSAALLQSTPHTASSPYLAVGQLRGAGSATKEMKSRNNIIRASTAR
mmetsp:Transcript_49/g.213  ORF Transcript_49/g.213 Transcript_49/m.213 type:complete len:863 (-) Transcript_49:641-3229(-)